MQTMPSLAFLVPGIPEVLLIAFVLIGPIVLIALLILRTRRRPPKTVLPPPAVHASSEDRQTILRRLAEGELSKAEAEEQLWGTQSSESEQTQQPENERRAK